MPVQSATSRQTGSQGSVPAGDGCIQVRVLGGFDLVVGSRSIIVGASCQRLLALLSIRERRFNRVQAAGLFWPDVPAPRANANLRSALWRLQRACPDVVDSTFTDFWLTDAVTIDLEGVRATARRLLDRSSPLSPAELHQALRCNLQDDVLPGLADEPWLSEERERHQQMRLHALEALAEQLTDARWFGAAVDAALSALRADPFRESACRLLVKAQLAEGNKLEARRQYKRYCAVLRDEMGLEPSESLRRLLGGQALPRSVLDMPVKRSIRRRTQERSLAPTGGAARLLPADRAGTSLAAKSFRALGDTNRLRLLEYLLKAEHTVSECVTHIGLSQGRVSTHLSCLASCGYVQVRREGRFAYYRVADPRVAGLVTAARAFASDNFAALAACTKIDDSHSASQAGHASPAAAPGPTPA